MAKTKRWIWYILLILIICTIAWFQLPSIIESASRNPVDSTAFQLRVYYESKHNVVPNTSKQTVVPNTSKQTVVQNTSKQPVVPNTSKQTVVPNTSEQSLVPNASKQTVVRTPSKQTLVQSTSEQAGIPNPSTQHLLNQNQNQHKVVLNQKKIMEKYLVYLCDEKRDCGGWGDRQRGMVSLFLLSLVWKRKFKIVLTTPCDIKPFYKPTKEYNWIFTEDELKGLKGKRTKTLDFISHDKPLINLNMNSSKIAEVLYIKTNCYNFLRIAQKYAKFVPSYLQNKGRAGIFRESWSRFMIPTDKILSQVVTIGSRRAVNVDAKKSGKELVCAHLRIGRSEHLPNDYVGFPLVAVPKVWDFIDGHFPNTSRIFVATDHPDVRKSAISKYGTRYIGSYAYTMNPDNMRSNITLACSSQESAYVDQLMLSKCDVLIYYRRSGFSIHASYLKTEWTNIYSIMRNGKSRFSLEKTKNT